MWQSLPRFAKIASYIAAIAGAIIGVGSAWTMLDLPVLATRGYVDKKEYDSNLARGEIVAVVVELARDQKERLKRGREAIEARLLLATDPQVKADLQLLIAAAAQDVADVDSRLLALERLRGK